MSAFVLAGAALPVAATYLLLQPARRAGLSPAAAMALAVGLGLGIASCAFFLALILFDGRRAGVIGIDTALLLLGLIVWQRSRTQSSAPRQPFSARERLLVVAVLAAAAAAGLSFLANTLELPHGRWDAWATWNIRARWLASAGPAWRTSFPKPTIHGDYPLLLPATVARLWVYAGDAATAVPAAVGAAYATAMVLLLYAALATVRGRAQGLIGALCLLGTPLLLRIAPWQYADPPLAFNVLAVLACLALYDHDPARGRPILVWAGVASGLAAWTKNEGMMLVLCILVVRGALALLRRRTDLRAAPWFLAGFLPPALMMFYFKRALAPPSPHYSLPPGTMIRQLLDPERYGIIFRIGGWELARGTLPMLLGLVIYALLLGRTGDRGARRLAAATTAIIVLATLGFVFTYLTARADLTWLVGLSVDRLELQLWPSVLLAVLLYLASPAEYDAAALRAAVADRRPGKTRAERRRRG